MRIIVTSRQAGKTEKMIRYLSGRPEMIGVVINEIEKDRLIKLYGGKTGIIQNDQLVSLSQVKNGYLRGKRKMLVVDNLDLMLYELFDYQPVNMITMTGQTEA